MKCTNCNGAGRVPDAFGGPRWMIDCEDCDGSGVARCDGSVRAARYNHPRQLPVVQRVRAQG